MNESTPVTAAVDARTRARLDADAAQLKALGYTSKFDRTMSELENFSLGFTYLSPVVGVYSLFAFALAAGGPPMFWWYLLVAIGQLFVCLVFGEVSLAVPDFGRAVPVVAAPGGQALGMDGRLGVRTGVDHHHIRSRDQRRILDYCRRVDPVRPRARPART